MQIETILAKIDTIKRVSKTDFEAAHCLEDELRLEFLQYVASMPSDSDIALKAKLILKTEKLEFDRCCA